MSASPAEQQAQALVDQLTAALRPVLDAVRSAVEPVRADPRLRPDTVAKALISDQLFELCGGTDPDDTAAAVAQNELASERVEAILAFIDLAKAHSLPRKLLPRGDRLGDWLAPGERVVVYNSQRGVVSPPLDLVRVKLDGFEHPVDFPRRSVEREA